MVTLAHPPTHSSLKIANHSFRYAAPCLWNELPTDLREPRQIQSHSLSPIKHGSSSSSLPSSLSPLASFLTRSVFPSELKTWLFGIIHFLHRPFPFLYRTDSTDFRNHLMFLFCLTAGFVCMVCYTKPALLSRLSNALKIIALSFPNDSFARSLLLTLCCLLYVGL